VLQEGDDSDVLIDGYVDMLDRLTHCLRSAQLVYNPVFSQSVLFIFIYLLLNRTRSTDMHTGYIHTFNSKLQTKNYFRKKN